MVKIIQSVRTYTELTDITGVDTDVCDLNLVLEDVLQNLAEPIEQSNAKVIWERLPKVNANDSYMIRLFQNLIGNSIFYRRESPPQIKISYKDLGEKYEFVVLDKGVGISNEHISEVFKPLKRFSKLNQDGSGLGLAIVKKIVESHDGKIWCESELNVGTSMFFTLSKCKGVPALKIENPKATTSQVFGQEHLEIANILFVDDSIDDLFLSRLTLQKKGKLDINFYSAANGEEAIEFLVDPMNPNIHLVVLDLNMPIMDGFEFLREKNKHVQLNDCRVVVCSSSDFKKDIDLAKSLGAQDYIVKPFNCEDFLRVIQRATEFQILKDGDHQIIYILSQR